LYRGVHDKKATFKPGSRGGSGIEWAQNNGRTHVVRRRDKKGANELALHVNRTRRKGFVVRKKRLRQGEEAWTGPDEPSNERFDRQLGDTENPVPEEKDPWGDMTRTGKKKRWRPVGRSTVICLRRG